MRLFILSVLSLTFLCGCNSSPKKGELRQWMVPNGKVKVLATTGMIADMVSQIGNSDIDTITLIRGDLDPHSYQLVKGDDEKLTYADIIFYNGLGLEHGPTLESFLKNSRKGIALGDSIFEISPGEIIFLGPTKDPHVWMDVNLWKKTIPIIVATLSDKDPKNGESYRLRGQKLYQQLDLLDEEIQNIIQSIPEEKRYLVTSHDAFNYFARAYLGTEEERETNSWQKRFQSPEGLAPDSQLSSHEIQSLIEFLKGYNISVLFPESNLSKDSVQKIVDAGNKLGLQVKLSSIPLYADAMGSIGTDGDTYIKMMRHNAKTIHNQLSSDAKTKR